MAVYRKISSAKSWFICVVVLIVLFGTLLVNNFHGFVNKSLVPDATNFHYNQIPARVPLYKEEDNLTAAQFWNRVDDLITNDSLYPEDFDVYSVVNVLRHAKVVKADLFLERVSYKWNLQLQGGQRILFKPKIVETSYRPKTWYRGCEHPENEIAGFTINRLLGFRNFPFTTGRILNWTKEILPVATSRLKDQMNITKDGDVCFKSQCPGEHETSIRCFKNGIIPGAMIYFLRKKIFFRKEEGRDEHHEFDPDSILFKPYRHNLPGDSTYCRIFRNLSAYRDLRDFGDFLDAAVISYITDHRDQKTTVIRDRSISLAVMFDYGLAFHTEYAILLAAPIYQCCLIRRTTYERLIELATTLPSKFEEHTRDDPLYPILRPEQILTVAKRIRMLLSLTNYCIELKGYENVAKDFL